MFHPRSLIESEIRLCFSVDRGRLHYVVNEAAPGGAEIHDKEEKHVEIRANGIDTLKNYQKTAPIDRT